MKLIINVVPSSAPNPVVRINPAPLISIRIDPTKNIGVANGKFSFGVKYPNEKSIGIFHITEAALKINNPRLHVLVQDFCDGVVTRAVATMRSHVPGAIITRVEAQSALNNQSQGEHVSIVKMGQLRGEVTMEFKSIRGCPINFTVELFGCHSTSQLN